MKRAAVKLNHQLGKREGPATTQSIKQTWADTVILLLSTGRLKVGWCSQP